MKKIIIATVVGLGIISVFAVLALGTEYSLVGNEVSPSKGIDRSIDRMPMVSNDKVIDKMPMVSNDKVIDKMPKVGWRDSGIQDRMPRDEPPMAQSAR